MRSSTLAACGLAVVLMGSTVHAELLGKWTFNNIRNNEVPDVSGQDNPGKLVNNPENIATGKTGNMGLRLDAKKQQGVDLGAQFHPSDKLTLEIWLKPEARPDYETIVLGKGSAVYGLSFYRDGRAYFYVGGGSNHIDIDLMLEETAHLVGTYDGTTMKLYLNGEVVAEKEIQTRAPASDRSLTIGLPNPDDKAFFTGVIDEAAVYDHVLDAAEVAAQYKVGPVSGK